MGKVSCSYQRNDCYKNRKVNFFVQYSQFLLLFVGLSVIIAYAGLRQIQGKV